MPFLRTTQPSPKYIHAKKLTLYVLCTASALVFVILFLIVGFRLAIDPQSRTSEAYIWVLTFAFSTIAQCLGLYAVWKENIILGFVHLVLCGIGTLPYKLHYDESGDRTIAWKEYAAVLVFLVSALIQWLLMKDLLYLRKHPNYDNPEPQIPNPKYTAIKRWILLIGCSVTAGLLALGFCAFGIYMFFVEPTVQSIETYFLEVILLAGSACQLVGFLGVWYERLLYVAVHITLCTIMLFVFGFYALNYKFLDSIEATAIFGIFYISALISLSFALDLRRRRKNYSIPGNNDADNNNTELKSVEQSN